MQPQVAKRLADYGASHFYMITQARSRKMLRILPTMVLRTIETEKDSHVWFSASRTTHGCLFLFLRCSGNYIIPMPPPMPPAGIAGASSLMSATTDSVVRNVEATDVAFCNAVLVTFTGSIIPASIIFTYSSL